MNRHETRLDTLLIPLAILCKESKEDSKNVSENFHNFTMVLCSNVHYEYNHPAEYAH